MKWDLVYESECILGQNKGCLFWDGEGGSFRFEKVSGTYFQPFYLSVKNSRFFFLISFLDLKFSIQLCPVHLNPPMESVMSVIFHVQFDFFSNVLSCSPSPADILAVVFYFFKFDKHILVTVFQKIPPSEVYLGISLWPCSAVSLRVPCISVCLVICLLSFLLQFSEAWDEQIVIHAIIRKYYSFTIASRLEFPWPTQAMFTQSTNMHEAESIATTFQRLLPSLMLPSTFPYPLFSSAALPVAKVACFIVLLPREDF